MQAKVRTVAFQGIDVLPIDVQVMIAPGQLAFAMVGLADKAVGESRERIRAAMRALGLSLPPQRRLAARGCCQSRPLGRRWIPGGYVVATE